MKKSLTILAVLAVTLVIAACDAPPAEGTPKANGEQTKAAPIKGGEGKSQGISPDMVKPTGVQPQTGSKVGGQ
ncbi:MAG: hypothetical protein KF857_11655 [Fimbriimonadaceae bacterium]|nr:hypothetical protein [Fimbriimonadaceae bacterium]